MSKEIKKIYLMFSSFGKFFQFSAYFAFFPFNFKVILLECYFNSFFHEKKVAFFHEKKSPIFSQKKSLFSPKRNRLFFSFIFLKMIRPGPGRDIAGPSARFASLQEVIKIIAWIIITQFTELATTFTLLTATKKKLILFTLTNHTTINNKNHEKRRFWKISKSILSLR